MSPCARFVIVVLVGGIAVTPRLSLGAGNPDGAAEDAHPLCATYGGPAEKHEMLARNRAELFAARKVFGRAVSFPDLDLSNEVVVAIAMGRRLTGGYHIRFEESLRSATDLIIRVTLAGPAPGQMTTQALTAPYCVARFARRGAQNVSLEVNDMTAHLSGPAR